jgi:hypothetical protein
MTAAIKRRWSFSLWRVLVSVFLFATSFGAGRLFLLRDDGTPGREVEAMVLFVLTIACPFAAVGVLFRRGVIAAILGATIGIGLVIWFIIALFRGLSGL